MQIFVILDFKLWGMSVYSIDVIKKTDNLALSNMP